MNPTFSVLRFAIREDYAPMPIFFPIGSNADQTQHLDTFARLVLYKKVFLDHALYMAREPTEEGYP